MRKAFPDTTTENLALSYTTSGSALVDLFFSAMVRNATSEKIDLMMQRAWNESPEKTIKIILHARNCRGGKGEKEVCLIAMLWLRINKPKTYAKNLRAFLDMGYYKDLLNLCVRCEKENLDYLGDIERLELEILADDIKKDHKHWSDWIRNGRGMNEVIAIGENEDKSPWKIVTKKKKKRTASEKDKDKDNDMKDEDDDNKAPEAPYSDEKVPKRKHLAISLASKWAPSEKSKFDKELNGNLALRLAKLLFPSNVDDKKDNLYSRYRRYLAPLRAQTAVTERLMCSGKWSQIDFSKVPSRAHHIYKNSFIKHDQERYKEYLGNVKKGVEKINVGGVMPHELVRQCRQNAGNLETVEVQWMTIIKNLKEECNLGSALAVVDVSGSMYGTPVDVAVALGLILCELAAPPFHRKLITFSTNPKFHTVNGTTLLQQVENCMKMDWGGSTDIEKVFDCILKFSIKNKVLPQSLPKRLFIFSDMQFDQATAAAYGGNVSPYMTTYQRAQEAFTQHGYSIPNIVFWNLQGATVDFPVRADTPGVAMISGFTADLMRLFLKGGELSALSILEMALSPYPAEIDESEV